MMFASTPTYVPARTGSAGDTGEALTVLVVDDHPIVRFGIASRIQSEWPSARIHEAATIRAAVSLAAELAPNLVILDLRMSDISGAEGVLRMLRAVDKCPILVMSSQSEPSVAARLIQMGVAGFLSKDAEPEELIVAVRRLRAGKPYLMGPVTEYLIASLRSPRQSELLHERLSTQEYRVMLLIASGKAPAQIGDTMHLSPKTVGTYRRRIFEKTGLKNNVELTKHCLKHGLANH
jgi:DNA-binding NarL/FixJ family response regulator